ncbi:MAG TPA: hypothetical protein VMS37_16620 [Verrucomicrobiae bacterium]|nr:hypothetical protein [Verrucomicrobiae bacterium]
MGLSGPERGEENLAKVRKYLTGLRAAGQSLPQEEHGRPNISAIAQAAGVLRNVFYTNSGVKGLLVEFMGGGDPAAADSLALLRAQQQADAKGRRVLRLEQQLAAVKAENEELRGRLAAAEQELARRAFIEEHVIKVGKRVLP